MLFFSIGLPTRFAAWCDAVTAQLVTRGLGPAESVVANTADELIAAVIRSGASHIVVCSRQPATRLQSEIIHSARPFLVALGDPRTALQQLRESANLGLA